MSVRRGRKRTAAAALLKTDEQKEEGEKPSPWEKVEIKLEEAAEENGSDDIKPDVNELQQQLTQQHVFGQQSAPVMVASPLAALPPSAKRVLIIGDLACVAAAGAGLTLTPLHNNSSNSGGVLCSAADAGAGVAAVGRGAKVKRVSNAHAAVPIAPTATTPTATKVLDDTFEKDEFDLQESDTDEEGYSDIDFDEDDELIEDDEEIDVYDPTWTDQPTAPRKVFQFERIQLDVGLAGRPKSVTPIFYFDKLLGDKEQFFSQLALGCNERAQQLYNDNVVGGQTYLKEISSEEMQIFFGLCLQMSTFKLPTLADYWNEEQPHYRFRGFGGTMSLNRFQMLLRVLNFERLQMEVAAAAAAAPKTTKEPEAFGNLRPLLDFFNQRMAVIYKCGQRLVLNEPVVFWKGRFNWLRDMREKFRGNAIALHFLTENTGLLLKIAVDVERKERKQHVRNSRLLVEQRVALAKELLQGKLEFGHTVYVSKYYSSYALGLEMSGHKTYCTGLLDNKRYGNSKQLIMKKLKKHEFATKYAPPIMMGKWYLREKCVYFYSSDCLAIYAKETSRYSNDPRPKIVKELDWQLKLPANIKEYMQNYQISLDRREIKWDRQLAVYIFNLIVLNSYILYTMYAQFGRARIIELHLKDTTKLKTYAEFRQDIIASFLSTDDDDEQPSADKPRTAHADSEEDEGEPSESLQAAVSSAHKKLLETDHMPMVIPRRKGKVMKKKCRICRKGGMLTFSKLCCDVCPGMPGLCEAPCFKIWHDQLKKSLEAGERIKTRTFGKSGEKTIYF